MKSAENPTAVQELKIAVLVPCYNEEVAITMVIEDFQSNLPEAVVYVYDNNSSDRTIEVAKAAGATVRSESLQGKGNVVRRMFAEIEADYYVLVDGDDTYDAASVGEMLRLAIDEQLDMVNASRVTEKVEAYRPGHVLGNRMLSGIVTSIFGDRIKDLLSGYRVFSRRYVKSFPALSSGFEIETELTVHALEVRMPVAEVQTPYKERPEGSESKLSTIRDGIRILKTIGVLVKEERPLQFFSVGSFLFFLLSLGFGVPVALEYFSTGLVPRLPTAVLSSALMLLAFLSLFAGLILDSVTRARREMKRIWYLNANN